MKAIYALVVGLALVLAANAAYASPDGTDPSVIINKTMNSGGPSDPLFETNSIQNPIIVTLDENGLSPIVTFTFDPGPNDPQTLSNLFVELENAQPFEVFTCESDIFSGPCDSFNPYPPVTNAVGLEFTMGTVTAGESFDVSTPEPESWIMLVASMLGLFLFGMKYWEPNRSAQ